MPIYEYQCGCCGNQYEALVIHSTEDDIPECPNCGTLKVKKIISTASVIRSSSQRDADRVEALTRVNPNKPQEVARHFKNHGSRFGETDFRGKKVWRDAVDRVSRGGPTLKEK